MLIELLITLGVGLLIVSVILEIYLTNVRSYRLQSSLNQIQDNAKTAIDILTTDIHRAGYIGCARLTADFPMASYLSYSLTPQNKLTTDHNKMVIRHMSMPAAVLLGPVQDTSILSVSKHVSFKSGDILMIADCKHADIFQAKEVKMSRGQQTIYLTQPLQYQYEQQAEVGRLEINTYFIENTQRKYLDGTPIYSLFVKGHHQRKFELVEGIQQMTIRYSIKHGGSLVELPGNEITDGSNVVGVAIDLIVVSPPIKKNWYLYATVGRA